MQEFNLDIFTNDLREEMYIRFPYEQEYVKMKKHFTKPFHIRDVAFKDNPIIIDTNKRSFDIGNYYAEQEYPYYHILQDAPVIRKRYKGTEKTKGSQELIKEKKTRDYNKVSFNGKTYSREYAKNIRGKRNNVVENATRWEYGFYGKPYQVNKKALSYKNIHYHYIDNILDMVLPILAMRYGGKMLKTRNTSLEEDYNLQETHEESERYMLENMLNSYLD